jgi:hypothetical protein
MGTNHHRLDRIEQRASDARLARPPFADRPAFGTFFNAREAARWQRLRKLQPRRQALLERRIVTVANVVNHHGDWTAIVWQTATSL